MRTAKKWAIAGAAAALPLLAVPATAQAQEEVPSGPEVGQTVPTSVDPDGYLPPEIMLLQAQLPTCLEVRDGPPGAFTGGQVHFTNNCPTDQRAKAVVAFYPDSQCFVLAPGASETYDYTVPGRFDGAVSC